VFQSKGLRPGARSVRIRSYSDIVGGMVSVDAEGNS